jgi:L-malate glycosyltransferase
MNILWITNIIFPAPSKVLGIQPPVSGGWMFGIVKQVSDFPDIHLAVATTYSGSKLQTYTIDDVIYYLLPTKSLSAYQKTLEPIWRKVCDEFTPDIIHIHGTEFPHGLACMRSNPNFKYLVSIQGIVSVISRYYYANISKVEIIKNLTFRDIVRLDTIFQGKRSFQKRGEFEKEYILRSNCISGRTSWDYAHVKSINPNVIYNFCNRTLRDSFYTSSKWNINQKNDFTIFLSQSGYPIKGLHQVLKAIACLKVEYPKINVRIAGLSIILYNSLLDKIKLSGYGSYIRNLIKRLNLKENVNFIGTLTEEQMVAEYKNAHLFICPSSIENSPNSLGEAQIIGVPCIASYVGGIPDMIEQCKTGLLYRFEEVEMLTENIRMIFSNNKLAIKLSTCGIEEAEKRHDRSTNLNRILEIYKGLMI